MGLPPLPVSGKQDGAETSFSSKREPEPAAVYDEPPQAAHRELPPGAAALSAETDGAQKPRSKLVKGAVLSLLGFVGSAFLANLVGLISLERPVNHGWWHAKGLTLEDPTSCENTDWLRQVKKAEASAQYDEPGHVAAKTTDDNRNTAWIQTLRRADDDLIAWTFAPNEWRARLVCITNGWARGYDTFTVRAGSNGSG